MPSLPYEAFAFGLRWRSDLPLPEFDSLPPEPAATWGIVDVVRNPAPAPVDRGGGTAINRGWVYPDGVRFAWEREVVFDMIGGDHVLYTPGPDWRGSLPAAFYGTLTALLLAWRGAIPFHASAVALGGKAILIAGASGGGKSTLTAGLIRAGARFVSDDLTAVRPDASGAAQVWRGRPVIRLSREMADSIEGKDRAPVDEDARDKWQIAPSARSEAAHLPLGAIVVLGDPARRLGGERTVAVLARQMFRPRWLATFPNRDARMAALVALAATVPTIAFPAIDSDDPPDLAARTAALIDRLPRS